MADIQAISAIIFIFLMCLLLYSYRKKLSIQKIAYPLLYVILWKTKLGLGLMDRMAKRCPRLIRFLGYCGAAVGFIGMAVIAYLLVKNLVNLIIEPAAGVGVGLVLPFKLKGTFYVPFFYWIISIFIIAVVHEFSHGVVARAHGFKVRSSGLAFLAVLLPILPAAFVEPDEKKLVKSSLKSQLSVFAAGPFSNIILGIVAALIFVFLLVPAGSSIFDPVGMNVASIEKNESYPAYAAGMLEGEVITGINGEQILTLDDFQLALNDSRPGDRITITTNRTSYSVVLGANQDSPDKPYLGIFLKQESVVKQSFKDKYGNFAADAIIWFVGLFYWLYLLNVGIGLFNLLPLSILDGGRMFYSALLRRFSKETASNIFKNVSIFFLIIIIINIFVAFVL